MKCNMVERGYMTDLSRPVRGAWVEIKRGTEIIIPMRVSRPVRGAWVEI